MNLSISINHVIIVALILLLIISLTILGIYNLIKRAVRKGTSEAIENNKNTNK